MPQHARRWIAPALGAAARALNVGRYSLNVAQNESEVRSALRLRFRVFNLELGEGLGSAHTSGEDRDEFDAIMRHLIVRDTHNDEVVGTYRVQTGTMAAQNLGYYSAREFDFSVYESRRETILELGRACIDAAHRNLSVLSLLWRGIATYALAHRCHLLVGCSSLTSQDPAEGVAAYAVLRDHQVSADLRTTPIANFGLPPSTPSQHAVTIPKLLRAYVSIGAKIAGPPAIDREFGTIDFLTILDLHQLPAMVRSRFLSY